MTAAVVRLADYRKGRRFDATEMMLDQFEFLALCNIAVLYGLICACRIANAR